MYLPELISLRTESHTSIASIHVYRVFRTGGHFVLGRTIQSKGKEMCYHGIKGWVEIIYGKTNFWVSRCCLHFLGNQNHQNEFQVHKHCNEKNNYTCLLWVQMKINATRWCIHSFYNLHEMNVISSLLAYIIQNQFRLRKI